MGSQKRMSQLRNKNTPSTLMNKTLIMAKLKPEENDINNMIKDGFKDPIDYLKVNPNLIIGRTIRGPRFDENKNLIGYSIIGNTALFENAKRLNKHNNIKTLISKTLSSMNTSGLLNKKDQKRPYDYIEDEKVTSMYNDLNTNLEKNKDLKSLNEFMNDMPINIKKELTIQQASLDKKNNLENYSQNVSRYLARKSKKSEDELLMNKTDQFRIKKEFEELVLNKTLTSYENHVPLGNWIMNLRSDKNHPFPSTSYIYYGDPYKPFWVPVREKRNKSIDIVRNPLTNSKFEFKILNKNKSLLESQILEGNSISSNLNMITSFNSFSFNQHRNNDKNYNSTNSVQSPHQINKNNDMIVAGKNLLKSEQEVNNQILGKKIIYKKGYLDNHLYGTSTSLNAAENEKNLSNLSNKYTILSNYGSPHSKKFSHLKLNIIK